MARAYAFTVFLILCIAAKTFLNGTDMIREKRGYRKIIR